MDKNFLGYVYVICAALCWGLHAALAKWLFAGDLTPALLVQFRLNISTLILLVGLAAFQRKLLVIQLRDLPALMACGIVGIAINFFLYYYAIRAVTVAMGIFLQYLAPTVIAIYWIFRGEKPSRPVVTAIAGSLLGCFFVVKAYNVAFLNLNVLGIAAGIGAAVAWASQSIFAESLIKRYSPITVLFYGLVCAAVFWNSIYPPSLMLELPVTRQNIMGIFYVAIFGTIVPHFLFYRGIAIMRAARASIVATIEPVAAAVFAYFLVGESLEWPQILGGAMVIASIVLLQRRTRIEVPCAELS